MSSQRSFRLADGEDDDLAEALEEFAVRGQQADVIKLALRQLFGLEIPVTLRGVAGMFELPLGDGKIETGQTSGVSDEQRAFYREILAEFRQIRQMPLEVAASAVPFPDSKRLH